MPPAERWELQRIADEVASEKPSAPVTPLEGLFTLLFLLLFGAIIWAAFTYSSHLFELLGSFIVGAWLRLVYLVIILCTAVGLYFFRKREKWLYGILECGFGSVLAWTALGVIQSGLPTDLTKLIAATYFIVRGLINWREGIDERRRRNKT